MTGSPRPCDPGPLDDLVCQAKGVEAQANYNKEQETKLAEARTAFGKARAAYGTARYEAENALSTGYDDVKRLLGDRCRVGEAQKQRLDRAFHRVRVRLEECLPEPCCEDGECDWDDEVGRCQEPDDVAALIARIHWHIGRATRCFADLLEETTPAPPAPATPAPTPAVKTPPAATPAATPAAATAAAATAGAATAGAAPTGPPATSPDGLAARVARVLAEIANIEAHAETWNATHVYAAALVARWHLQTVWNGFDDVNEYVDCLCRALTCMIKGHAAIARLKRRAAVAECHRQTWEKACAALDAQAVDEVLAEDLRLCAAGDDGDSDGDDCAPDGDSDDNSGDGDGDGGGGGHGGGHGGDGHGGGGHGGGTEPPRYDRPSRPAPADPGLDRPYSGRASSADERGDARGDDPDRADPRGRGARNQPRYRDTRGRYRAP